MHARPRRLVLLCAALLALLLHGASGRLEAAGTTAGLHIYRSALDARHAWQIELWLNGSGLGPLEPGARLNLEVAAGTLHIEAVRRQVGARAGPPGLLEVEVRPGEALYLVVQAATPGLFLFGGDRRTGAPRILRVGRQAWERRAQ